MSDLANHFSWDEFWVHPPVDLYVLDFWKINLEKSSSTNWIFNLFWTGFLLPVLCSLQKSISKLLKLIFYNLFFKNKVCTTNQQGEGVLSSDNPAFRKCPGAVCFAIFNLFYFFVQKSLAIKHTKAIVAQLCNFWNGFIFREGS